MAEVETEVNRLADTGSIEDARFMRILDWSNKHLCLMKWSRDPECELDDKSRLKQKLQPKEELFKPA